MSLGQLRYRFVRSGAQLFKSRWYRRFNPVIDLPLRHPLQAIAQSSYNGLLSLFPRSSLILVYCCIPERHHRPTKPADAIFIMRAADLNACVPGSQRFHVDHSGNIRIRYGPAEKPSGRYRSEEHTSELQSLMRISYAVFCLKKQNTKTDVRKN